LKDKEEFFWYYIVVETHDFRPFDSSIVKSWQFNGQTKGTSSASLLHYGQYAAVLLLSSNLFHWFLKTWYIVIFLCFVCGCKPLVCRRLNHVKFHVYLSTFIFFLCMIGPLSIWKWVQWIRPTIIWNWGKSVWQM
jgi:hypothetical protein